MNMIEKIKAIIDNGALPHAVIIESAAADAAAEYIALAAVCTGSDKPCKNCEMCRKAIDGNHPDIKKYQGDGTPKPFPVDLVREIRSDVFIIPNEADHKVYILSDADNMSPQSQNALLKILEEPPAYAVFIITCKNKSTLLDTVLSRAVIFSEQSENVPDEQTAELAEKAVLAVIGASELELLKICYDLSADKETMRKVLIQLKEIFRGVYTDKLTSSTPANALGQKLTAENAVALIAAVDKILDALTRNANASLNATRLCALLRDAAGK